jgi:Glycosyltransferase family 92
VIQHVQSNPCMVRTVSRTLQLDLPPRRHQHCRTMSIGERLRLRTPHHPSRSNDALSRSPDSESASHERKIHSSESSKRKIASGRIRVAGAVTVGCLVCACVPRHLAKRSTTGNGIPSSSLPISTDRTIKDGTKTRASARARQGLQKRTLTIYAQSAVAEAAPQGPSKLDKFEFGQYDNDCSRVVPLLPVDADEFPTTDPYLPWIHDYFVSHDGAHVSFVAQNRRRCQTGQGMEPEMKHWEPQVALFQPVPVRQVATTNRTAYALTSPERATYPETRFMCSFEDHQGNSAVTFSTYPFNYEYIAWRKGKAMFVRRGKDVEFFEFSTLMFRCPIPPSFRYLLNPPSAGSNPTDAKSASHRSSEQTPRLWLDVVPIRTKARYSAADGFLLTEDHVGPLEFTTLRRFDAANVFGTNSSSSKLLPEVQDAGRWANLAICPPPPQVPTATEPASAARKTQPPGAGPHYMAPKVHNLVLCTWTSASYKRRGDAVFVDDAALRLREWIAFHRIVGVDHIYLYDNTSPASPDGGAEMPLRAIAAQFPGFVTHVPWPYQVCSNNRPNYKNPGERSSQYAAEASCRERFGPATEWMSFLDTDEYLVPLLDGAANWTEILRTKKAEGHHVLKLRSARGKPRVDLMEPMGERRRRELCPSSNKPGALPEEPCIVPRRNETFLKVYNCNYIRPPIPDRFARAMKQIYRPSFVYSHFVHYSTVTAPMARYYKDWDPLAVNYSRRMTDSAYW